MNDPYKLNASVNVYSVGDGRVRDHSGGPNHHIKVIDRHKLPDLKVTPPTATVKEGARPN